MIDRAETLEEVVTIAMEYQTSDKPVKVSLSPYDFKVIYNDYLDATGEKIKVGKPYGIGPVDIIFSKRRE